jgi:ketosteroid isomerase-like protein
MSQENVETIRRAFDAYAQNGAEAIAEFWDPEIEVKIPTDLAQTGTYRGRDAVLGWMSDWDEAWEEIDYTASELRDAGDAVLATVAYDGRGQGSGMRIQGTFWYLMELRDGNVLKLRLYGDEAEALEALERQS